MSPACEFEVHSKRVNLSVSRRQVAVSFASVVAARPNARTWNPSPRTSKPSPKTSKPSPRTLKPSREPPSSASESTYFPFLLRNVGRRRRPKAARSAAQRRRRREAPPRPTARKSLSAEGAIVGPGPLAMNSKTMKHKPTETQMPSCTARENKGRRQQPAGLKNHRKSRKVITKLPFRVVLGTV